MANRRLLLRGEGALTIDDAGMETEVVARVGGVLHARNVDLAGDLIVRDEMHCHDPVRHVRRFQEEERDGGPLWVNTADVGTMYVVPCTCVLQLPDAPPQGVPLLYEVVGSDIDSLEIRGRLAPTSTWAVDGAMHFPTRRDSVAFTAARGLRLHVRSCITPRDDSDGTPVYAFRITGTVWSR